MAALMFIAWTICAIVSFALHPWGALSITIGVVSAIIAFCAFVVAALNSK